MAKVKMRLGYTDVPDSYMGSMAIYKPMKRFVRIDSLPPSRASVYFDEELKRNVDRDVVKILLAHCGRNPFTEKDQLYQLLVLIPNDLTMSELNELDLEWNKHVEVEIQEDSTSIPLLSFSKS